MTQKTDLEDLGWSADFRRQLDPGETGRLLPARISAVHRDRLDALTEAGPLGLRLPPGLSAGEVAVGDWVLAEPGEACLVRVLERRSLLRRKAAGRERRDQLIAANIDTLFITTSANADFNLARLERYLALAHTGGVAPVIVLTKADLCDDLSPYTDTLRDALGDVPVVTLDARDPQAAGVLTAWCGPGRTVAFVGSSGVGKSTLVQALTGAAIATRGVRAQDSKGRHTTTAREFHRLAGGGWVVDTPGMRELQLVGATEGIDEVFADIVTLAASCRFNDCAHEAEPGCAVQAAIETGGLDAARLGRWQKLKREDAENAGGLAGGGSAGPRARRKPGRPRKR
ncbi:MAG: ribosome small subunit-dependent GTPase A [Rhodobacterales bacterium]|nr:MAG: ribosome small subunit-dependent GTPase A [Rhodobacterales bacterium]